MLRDRTFSLIPEGDPKAIVARKLQEVKNRAKLIPNRRRTKAT